MRYGQKWLGKHRKMGSTYCAQCCPVFISSKYSVKILPKKKLLTHRRCNALQRGSKSHFSQKNAFFRQKMAFFEKLILFKIHQWPKIHHIHVQEIFSWICIWCVFGHWWILNKMNFSKNAIFCPKNAFFWEKWLFDPRRSAA